MADAPNALLIGKIARLRLLALWAQTRGDHYVAIGYARAANYLAQSIREPDARGTEAADAIWTERRISKGRCRQPGDSEHDASGEP
jgi:hypothetical protein